MPAQGFDATTVRGHYPLQPADISYDTTLTADGTTLGLNLATSNFWTGHISTNQGFQIYELATTNYSGLMAAAAAAGNYMSDAVAGDMVLRCDANADIIFGFKGAAGGQHSTLALRYPYTVETNNNTLDDGSGDSTFSGLLSAVGDALLGDVNGYIKVTADASYVYLEGWDGAKTGNKAIKLSGYLGAADNVIVTGNNVLDDGSGNMTANVTVYGNNSGSDAPAFLALNARNVGAGQSAFDLNAGGTGTLRGTMFLESLSATLDDWVFGVFDAGVTYYEAFRIKNTGGAVQFNYMIAADGGYMDTGNLGGARSGVTSSGTDAALKFRNTYTGGREYWWDSGASGAGVGEGNFALYDATAGSARFYVNSSGAGVFNFGLSIYGGWLVSTELLDAEAGMWVAGDPSGGNGQGGYLGWNVSGSDGETDFLNNHGGGAGGWQWRYWTGSAWSSPIATLTEGGDLSLNGTISASNLSNTIHGVSGSYVGNDTAHVYNAGGTPQVVIIRGGSTIEIVAQAVGGGWTNGATGAGSDTLDSSGGITLGASSPANNSNTTYYYVGLW